jgi:HAD superfamily phosphatase (TIGR01668 family)
MRGLRRPTVMAEKIWEVDLEALWERGVRGLLLDLDNTLVNWNAEELRPQVREWVEAAKRRGMRLCLVSNALYGRRVKRVAEALGIESVVRAGKPLPRAFRRGMARLGTEAAHTGAIGDQVFTDLVGANWAGLTTVLLAPLEAKESAHTRVIRLLERPLRRRWQAEEEPREEGRRNRRLGE